MIAYGSGTKAYIDCFSGLVPCVITKVCEPGEGSFALAGRIEVRVTANRPGYKCGEIVFGTASCIVPRKQVRVRCGKYRVNTQYRYV